tara:strand:- start:919 stop:1365 length:447 start_codon:yes stop_codon:yes gene_type:complete
MKILVTLILGSIALLFLLGFFSKPPKTLGVTNGKLAQCTEAKNCVSSQAGDEAHSIAPIEATGDSKRVTTLLTNSINAMGGKVISIEGPYLWAEFTSKVFRFVDDVECYYDQESGVIHIRSASRVGYYDFNANRKRVEELRQKFLAHN